MTTVSSLHNNQGAQGTVISYYPSRGYGFISCQQSPGVDLYFKSIEDVQIGRNIAFNVKIMPDGKPQAHNLVPALFEGQCVEGTVIRHVLKTGYGFIRIPHQPNDVFFHCNIVPGELQNQQLDGMQVRITITLQMSNMPQASSMEFFNHLPLGQHKL